MSEVLPFASLLAGIAGLFAYIRRKPNQHRNWVPEHKTLAHAEFHNGDVTLKNIIHAEYSDYNTCTVEHYDKTFSFSDVETVWFIIQYFPVRVLFFNITLAHSFLSFGFRDGTYISISVAGRRQINERITPTRILPKKNEIVYKVIDEGDTVFARAYFGNDEVRLYKLKVESATAQKVFRSMLEDVNKLNEHPSWFGTLTKNCTSELARHLHKAGVPVPSWHPSYVMTNGVDRLFHRKGVIDSDLPFEKAKIKHCISELVKKLGKDIELPKKVREFLQQKRLT